MGRGNFDDLAAFALVADHLSFRAAAMRLGVTPSALSHVVRQLEERLGVRLLNRTTRSMSLTDAGLRLLARARPAIDQLAGAMEDLKQERTKPFGRLKIHATHIAAEAVIAPVWARYLSMYPDVHLEVQADEAPVDIVAKGFDAGIGPQDRAAADMIAVRVMGPLKVAVVAAPAYFSQNQRPRRPEELARHTCVQYRRGMDGLVFEWPFERKGRSYRIAVNGRVMVNSASLAVRAAVDGLGIAYVFEGLIEPFLRSGQLVRVLEDWSPAFEGLFLFYPGNRQPPAALRALIDLIRGSQRSISGTISGESPFADEVKPEQEPQPG